MAERRPARYPKPYHGKTRAVTGYDGTRVRSASRRRPRTEWLALKPGAHEGY